MISLILVPFFAAILAGIVSIKYKHWPWAILLATTLFGLIQVWGKPLITDISTIPMGLSLFKDLLSITLYITPLGGIFLKFSALAFFVLALFSFGYNQNEHNSGTAPLWLLLIAANNLIFMTADMLGFFIAWETLTWVSYFLILKGKNSTYSATYYLYLSLIGAMTMLTAVLIIYGQTDSLLIPIQLDFIMQNLASPLGISLSILLLISFLTKSALIPFHMWPAKAHADAPDDFSGALSGIVVKYGLYGLLLGFPLMLSLKSGLQIHHLPWVLYLLGTLGAITAVVATVLAVIENDMKRLMAWSTVANIGFIVMGLATRSPVGVAAALFHTLNHMIFKAAIFSSLAAVKHQTGIREMHKLGGLAYRMPLTFLTFLAGIIALCGIPPLSGFYSKWLLFQAWYQNGNILWLIAGFFASMGAFLYSYRGLHSIFLGQLSDRLKDVKEVSSWMFAAQAIFILLMVAAGVFPGLVLQPIMPVLNDMSLSALNVTLTEITGPMSTINGLQIAFVFVFASILVAILFSLTSPQTKVDQLDNYTSGEWPEDWDLTPDKYQYAFKFYQPVHELFEPLLTRVSLDIWFQKIARSVNKLGEFIDSFYGGNPR